MESYRKHLSEQDRLQHHIAGTVNRFSSDIVFKGGTLLRTCIMPNYRYSADLDYDTTLDEDRFWETFAEICRVAAKNAHADIAIEGDPPRDAYDLKWATRISSGRMYIDVRWLDSAQSMPPCAHWRLQPNHTGIDTHRKLVLGYTEPSIVAAKLACVASPDREESRDLYDIYRILRERPRLLGIAVSIGASYFDVSSTNELLDALDRKKISYENDWKSSVAKEFLPSDIDFETVSKFVRLAIAGIA